MKIAHITDYHYNQSNPASQQKFVSNLIACLKTEQVDMLFFTGDLVDKGGLNGVSFPKAKATLFDQLIQDNVIRPDMIFLCCGNHDVIRTIELPAIRTHLNLVNNIDDLNKFVLDERQFIESTVNFQQFNSIQKEIIVENSDEVHPLYTVHRRIVSGIKIGIATINTAWRAFSDQDNKNLLFPPIFIEKIIDSLKDVNLKFIIMHHPLSYMKDFVFYDLENLIYGNFQYMFSGHTHTDRIETLITGEEGIFCCVSPSTITYNYPNDKVGFTIIDINDDNYYETQVNKYIYDKQNRRFYQAQRIKIQVPVDEEKEEIIRLKLSCRNNFRKYLDEANDLILSSYDTTVDSKTFLDIFTNPSIKNKSTIEIASSREGATSIDLRQLQENNNFLIFGKSKSGRTSILYKILLDSLTSFPASKTLPIYYDAKNLSTTKKIDFIKQISRTYSLTYKNTESIAKRYHFKLLIDNYTSTQTDLTNEIEEFIQKYNASVIVCMDETVLRSYDHKQIFNFAYNNLYIHEINRKGMRSLVQKWSAVPVDSEEILINKIEKVFKQLNIQFNFWSISLFLWIYKKTSNVTLNNNVELIQIYVDELLDKRGLTVDRTVKIKFEELKTFLSHLAIYFLTKENKTSYSASYVDIIKFVQEYRNNNIRFVIEVEELFELLKSRGILVKTINEEYTFRLNGVFEYFIAIYMKNHHDYRNDILKSPNYLSFGNELELYAGFESNDTEFVKELLGVTEKIFANTNIKYGDQNNIDDTLIKKYEDFTGGKISQNAFKESFTSGMEALAPSQKDEIMDEFNPINGSTEEVKLKETYVDIEENFTNLERSLRILARVFRNSSFDNFNLSENLLDFIMLNSCHLGFTIVDTINEENTDHILDQNSNEKNLALLEMTTRFMPLIINTFLSDALAQDNLERLINEKIQKLKRSEKNAFQIMLLYFLLIDVNPIRSHRYIELLINDVKLGILRHTILLKLYTYLIFFSYGNKDFQNYLKDRIRDLQILIDPKSAAQVSKRIELLMKKALLENSKRF